MFVFLDKIKYGRAKNETKCYAKEKAPPQIQNDRKQEL